MSKKRKDVKRKFFLVALVYIALGAILLQSVGSTVYQIYTKKKEKKEFEKELLELKDKEEELKATVTKLQDPDYVARYAREKYLYSKDGEIIIRIPD